jgi:hypothetical protein
LREAIDEVITALLGRLDNIRERHAFDYVRWLRTSALVFGLSVLLGLGLLTAVAMSDPGEERVYVANSQGLVTSATAGVEAQTNVVTLAVNRKGETVRVIRYRTTKSDVVLRTVTGPGAAVRATPVTVKDTRTVREIDTVTQVQEVTVQTPPVTVTVIETVTCKPNDC